jgi:hypothetical protein
MLRRALQVILPITFMALAGNAHAQLSGHNTKGDYSMFSGTQPDPGFYLSTLYVNYDTDTLRNRNGDKIPTQGELGFDAVAPIFTWVSNKKILGGNYGLTVAPAWATSALEAPIFGGPSSVGWNEGDLYIQPVVLGWHTPRADFTAGLGIFAPTGHYEFGGDNNTGLGVWSYEIFGGTTLYLDPDRTWSFAATAFFETHGKKEGTDIRVGDLLTIEGGLGKSFLGGAASAGIGYYGQWKLSRDDLGFDPPGFLLPGAVERKLPKHRVFGIGPELTLPIASKSKLYALANFRYFKEFGAKTTSEGETFLFTLTFPIPSIALQ